MNRGGYGQSAKPKEGLKSLKRLFGLVFERKIRLFLILIFSGAAVVLNVCGPKLLGSATNVVFDGVMGKMLPSGDKAKVVAALKAKGNHSMAQMLESSNAVPGQGIDYGLLAKLLLLVILLYLLAAILQFLAGWVVRTVVQEIGWNLRRRIHQKIDALPLSYLDKAERGDLLSRVTNDVDNLVQTLLNTMTGIFTAIFMVFGIGFMMFWISWPLTLIALLIIPIGLVNAGVLMKKAGPSFAAQWKQTGQVSTVVEDAFSGHLVMTTFNLHEQMRGQFKEANDSLFKAAHRAQFLSGLVQPAVGVISNFSFVVVAVAGGLQIISGAITIGALQSFIQYSRQFNQPVNQLASITTMLQSGAASAERVFEFLAEPEMPPQPVAELPADCEVGNIRFEHVRFGYTPEKVVINDLNLEVQTGQTVAIVGHTGAGKTTLVNLLMRFYDIDSGRILVGGVDVSTASQDSLRRRFGMVLQDTWLFGDTVAANIAYGAHDDTSGDTLQLDLSNVEAAARAANIHHMINALPHGYETVISESGDGLSAGQKQLITIARAFMADPEVLILDEATSSVDTRTEVLIQEALRRLRKGRTAFIIAHRLSTIRDADLILVMEAGDVVEMGSHADLLAADGKYAQIYKAQIAAADTV